ncbi:MAG: sorbitol-6-phosphate dehydrogenase subunit, partial [bacterium]
LKHYFVNTDVTNKESVDNLIGSTLTEFGHLDILVNNAGINIPRLLVDPAGQEELTEQIWDKVVMVNQKSAFLCAQAAARQMIKQGKGGAIINMASESGLEGSEGQSVYAATKAAMYSLTRSWAKELGKHNIRVVGVAPGILEATALRTPEYERALAYTRGITVEKLRSSYESVSIPLKRVGTLAEVGEVVCFLASDAASYVSGTVLNVSGGKSRA